MPRKKKTDRVRIKHQGKYRKQKDKQDDNHGSRKLTFSWKKLKKVSQPRSNNFKGLEPGCRRLRNDVETRGNGVSKNKPPTPETRDEKEMEAGKRK